MHFLMVMASINHHHYSGLRVCGRRTRVQPDHHKLGPVRLMPDLYGWRLPKGLRLGVRKGWFLVCKSMMLPLASPKAGEIIRWFTHLNKEGDQHYCVYTGFYIIIVTKKAATQSMPALSGFTFYLPIPLRVMALPHILVHLC